MSKAELIMRMYPGRAINLPMIRGNDLDPDWALILKSYLPKESLPKCPKAEYVTLYDRKGDPRVIMAFIHGMFTSYVGIAIRSALDDNDWKYGKRLAYSRAKRALTDRKPCVVRTHEACQNIHDLDYNDFMFLMKFTGKRIMDFPKSIKMGSAKQVIGELRDARKVSPDN